MRICILCHNPVGHTGRGIDRYTYELLKAFSINHVNVSLVQQGSLNYLWQWALKGITYPLRTLPIKGDVYFAVSQNLTPGLVRKKPLVTALHDVVPFMYSENRAKDWFYRFSAITACKESTRIITCSHASKLDIMKFLDFPQSKIDVIYHGVNSNLFYPFNIPRNLQVKRILFIGGSVRRQPQVLLKALAIIKKHMSNVRLLIAGKDLHEFELRKLAIEIGVNDLVTFLGFIPDSKLSFYYNIADVFAFPSIYEGFGFPVLESMACATPVVASNVGSLPEIVGKSGVLVESESEIDWANAILDLLVDDTSRTEFARKAFERSTMFSWSQCAAKTLAVLKATCD